MINCFSLNNWPTVLKKNKKNWPTPLSWTSNSHRGKCNIHTIGADREHFTAQGSHFAVVVYFYGAMISILPKYLFYRHFNHFCSCKTPVILKLRLLMSVRHIKFQADMSEWQLILVSVWFSDEQPEGPLSVVGGRELDKPHPPDRQENSCRRTTA